jgi:hypothetical protein
LHTRSTEHRTGAWRAKRERERETGECLTQECWFDLASSCRQDPRKRRPLDDDRFSRPGRWAGGLGGATDDMAVLTTRVSRAGAVPLATQGRPTTVWAASVEAALRGCR